jgi:hypothetical protein
MLMLFPVLVQSLKSIERIIKQKIKQENNKRSNKRGHLTKFSGRIGNEKTSISVKICKLENSCLSFLV